MICRICIDIKMNSAVVQLEPSPAAACKRPPWPILSRPRQRPPWPLFFLQKALLRLLRLIFNSNFRGFLKDLGSIEGLVSVVKALFWLQRPYFRGRGSGRPWPLFFF